MPPAIRKELLLKIKDLDLNIDGNLILSNVNAEIKNLFKHDGSEVGQVVALLGPSGIGKSQLFRMMSGLGRPNRGEVYVTQGQVPVELGMVGLVFQNYRLFDHRTVFSNLLVAAGANRKYKTRQSRLDSCRGMLVRFGLDEHENHYPEQLSGGQKQRVAIAQQLLCSEHYLLMDEPFSGLDPKMIDKVCDLIHEVAHADGLNTVIVATHDLVSACLVADTLWLMGRDRDKDGKAIPGAYIKKEYDLVERGLTWRQIEFGTPELMELLSEVKREFTYL